MSNIKEQIRAEIERRKKYQVEQFNKKKPDGRPNDYWTESLAIMGELEELLFFLDTLEEPVSEDLEEAAEEYASRYDAWNDDQDIAEYAFKAGAEWQKVKMMEEAVEGVIFQPEDYYPKELIAHYNGELKHGDKVKIIVVKEDNNGH